MTIQEKYNAAMRKHDYIGAMKYAKQIEAQNQTERISVRDLFSEMTEEQRNKAANLCSCVMVMADLISSDATDLQELLHKVDPTCELELYRDVKDLYRKAMSIVKAVDDFHNEEFSASFGDLCDKVRLSVQNIIYTERAKEERRRKKAGTEQTTQGQACTEQTTQGQSGSEQATHGQSGSEQTLREQDTPR